MYQQVLDPVSHSLGLTSIFALVPLAVLFVLLGVVRLKAQWAALITLGVAILVALTPRWRELRSVSGRSCGSSSMPCGSST